MEYLFIGLSFSWVKLLNLKIAIEIKYNKIFAFVKRIIVSYGETVGNSFVFRLLENFLFQ